MAEVEAPPAETHAPPVDETRTAEEVSGPEIEPRPSMRERLVRRVPPGLVARWRAFTDWSHTRVALRLGTVLLALMAFAAATSLFFVGVLGVGTHPSADYLLPSAGDGVPVSSGSSGLIGPPYLPGGPPLSVVAATLSGMVLQQTDLPQGMALQDQGTTGSDAGGGLLSSYHAVYQRKGPPASDQPDDQAAAVFSFVGAYSDSLPASHELSQLDLSQLGVEAGLPQLTATTVAAPSVGDESRALRLSGSSGSNDVGVYVIQFRDGPIVGVVGAVWPRGQESLDFVVRLARAQSGHIVAGQTAPPDLIP